MPTVVMRPLRTPILRTTTTVWSACSLTAIAAVVFVVGLAFASTAPAYADEANLQSYPPIETQPVARVAVLPVTLLQPAGQQSVQVAVALEMMLHHALASYAVCNVLNPLEVREALGPFDLTGGPGDEALVRIAQELEVDYIVCTTLRFAVSLELTGWWYRVSDASAVHGAIVSEAPISDPVREMNHFVEALAFRPAQAAPAQGDDENSNTAEPELPRDAAEEDAYYAGHVGQYIPTLMFLAEAKLAAWRGDIGQARSALERAAVGEPSVPGVQFGLAFVTIQELNSVAADVATEDIDEAVEALEAALAETPRAWHARWLQANLHVARAMRHETDGDGGAAQGQWAAADAVLQRMLTERPNAFAVWELLLGTVRPARIAAAGGDAAQGARLRLAQAAEELVAAYPDRPAAHRAAARGLMATGQSAAARSLLRPLWTASRRTALLYGELLHEAGSHGAALSVYHFLTVHHPHHRGGFVGKARALAHELFAALDTSSTGTVSAEDVAEIPELAAAFARRGHDEASFEEVLELLPVLGDGPFGYIGRDDGMPRVEGLATQLWHAALVAKALTPSSAALESWLSRFLESGFAEERLDQMRESYAHFLEVVQAGGGDAEVAEDVRPYLLVSWHLTRLAGEDAATLARDLVRRGYRVETVLAALYPRRDPVARYFPDLGELPQDELDYD